MKKIFSLICVVIVLSVGFVSQASARRLRPPNNDSQTAAAIIDALPFTHSSSLRGATLEADEVQPSCSSISASIWYALSTSADNNLIADLSAMKRSVVAVFESTPSGLNEMGCARANDREPLEVDAAAGSSYLIQVGAVGDKRGVVDLDLRLSDWVDETFIEHTYRREADEQHVPVVFVRGAPREGAPSTYDITFGISEQQPTTLGILTFGLVTQRVEAELLRIPASTTEVNLRVAARYDSSQYACAADNGSDVCYASIPLRDLNWLSGGEGSRAELVITLSASRNGETLQERTITVPYAGQPMGLLP